LKAGICNNAKRLKGRLLNFNAMKQIIVHSKMKHHYHMYLGNIHLNYWCSWKLQSWST